MVSVEEIIGNMRRRGMTDEQIKQNLRELGVTDIDKFFEKTTRLKEVKLAEEENEIKPVPFTKIEGEEERRVDFAKLAAETEKPELYTRVSTIEPEQIGNKLEEIIALLKTLQQVEKQILEANRDILLRLKMKLE